MKPMPYLLLFCFSLVLPSVSVCAQEADPPKTATIPAENTTDTATDPSIQQYIEQISAQEKLHGAYDPQLSEQLLGLGLLYQNLEQYEEAGKTLNRALHITKINDGLQNMTQVPILNALIKVNTAAGNWEELDQNYHLLLWVHQRNLKSGDPALLPVILTVGKWKLEAYSRGLLSDTPIMVLYDLINMFQTTVDIMEDLYGENDPRLIGPLKILAMANYHSVNQIAMTSIEDFTGFGNRVILQQRCYPIRGLDGRIEIVCGLVDVPNPDYFVSKQQTKDIKIGEQMHKVRSLLTRIAEINASNPAAKPVERAAALVNLGDWYFINNKSVTAVKNYKQAYQLLAVNEPDRDSLKKLFDKPVRIPVMTTALPGAVDTPADAVTPPFVKLSFDVTSEGRARNIEVIAESEPTSIRVRKTAKQLIQSSIFRPQLREGEPVATQATELLLSGAVLQNGALQNPYRNNVNSALKLRR